MGKKISDVVTEAKATKKGRGTKAQEAISFMESDAFKSAVALAVQTATAPLLTEIAALKATPTTKAKATGYNVLDNENYSVTGTFRPNVVKIHEKYGQQYPNFNFLKADGSSAIPDHVYRTVLKAFYGADFWKKTSLWSMTKAAFDRFNADLASGAFADQGRGVCAAFLAEKGEPKSAHGKAIVAFYMED